MYQHFITSGNIMHSNLGNHFETSSQQVCRADAQETCTKIKQNIFYIKSFLKLFVLLRPFLNQCETAVHRSLNGLKYTGFNLKYISNGNIVFYETFSPKRYGQVCMGKTNLRFHFLFRLLQLPLSLP